MAKKRKKKIFNFWTIAFVLVDDIILYMENHKESSKKLTNSSESQNTRLYEKPIEAVYTMKN
jgi:hypothetical protein